MSLRNRGETERKNIDEFLIKIVDEMKTDGCHELAWKEVSQSLWKKYQIKLNYKQCYYRYKNYLKEGVDAHLYLQPQKGKQIFQLHCSGFTNLQIRQQIKLDQITQNALKNTCKVPKQTMGRIIRDIYQDDFKKVDIPSNFFNSSSQNFRIFLILFSTSQLLKQYLKNKISIVAFKELTRRYDENKKNYEKSKRQTSKQSSKKYQTAMNSYKQIIIKDLETIFALYEEIYRNQSRRKILIGQKDKKLYQKYTYLKAILLKIPVKVIEGQRILNSMNIVQDVFQNQSLFEKGPSMSMETQQQMEYNFFKEIDSEICREDQKQNMFFLPNDQQLDLKNESNFLWGADRQRDFMDIRQELDSNQCLGR